MTQSSKALPDFDTPPVIETVLGVQFNLPKEFSILHYGLYFAKIRAIYPEWQFHPVLKSVVEQFEPEHLIKSSIGIEINSVPETRCWFIDNANNRLIQIQKDRFVQNWRKLKEGDVYPRYKNLKPKFKEEWQRFVEFLAEEKLGIPEVNQCEVTYINHIEIGKGSGSFGEINKVIKNWSQEHPGEFLPQPEKINLSTRFVMPDNKGRLHINLNPAIRTLDAKGVFQLELTARGKPNSSSLEDILEWFDLGHEWIVSGFTDFTATEMHEKWGRKL